MRLKSYLCILLSVVAHTANLQEALAVTTGDLRAIVIELAIIDVIFMLGVNGEDIGRLLSTFIIRLAGLMGLSLATWIGLLSLCHRHLHLILLRGLRRVILLSSCKSTHILLFPFVSIYDQKV